MRLIDADELLEHAYRDRLDSRELIADMIKSAPTVEEIPINIPLSLIIKALEQEPKTGSWVRAGGGYECSQCHIYAPSYQDGDEYLSSYCPKCGARMV